MDATRVPVTYHAPGTYADRTRWARDRSPTPGRTDEDGTARAPLRGCTAQTTPNGERTRRTSLADGF